MAPRARKWPPSQKPAPETDSASQTVSVSSEGERRTIATMSMVKQLLGVAAGWWGFHYGSHAGLKLLSSSYRRMAKGTKLEVLQNLSCLVVSAIIFPLYYVSSKKLDQSARERFEGYSRTCHNALLLHSGQCIYETSTYLFQKKGLEFYLHHVLVLVNYFDVLRTGTMQYFAAKDGIVEGTNVPLCMVTLLRLFGKSDHPLYAANGLGLWVLFLALRIVNLPLVIKQWREDLSSKEGKDCWERNSTLAKYTAMPTTAILWLLSLAWMIPITSGLLKTIRPYLSYMKWSPEAASGVACMLHLGKSTQPDSKLENKQMLEQCEL